VFYLARQNDRAIEQWRKALDLEPNLGSAHTAIWMAYVQQGGSAALIPPVADTGEVSPLDLASMAGIYATSGRRLDAENALSKLKELSARRYVCPYEIATAHAALGQRDEAIAWLRKGVERRSVCMPDMKMDPRLDGLRSDPRFKDLLRDVGFAP
jgi:tetratricopeptide (TPR) repeat protein